MMEKTLERRGRRLLKGGDDEDIPTITPSPHDNEDTPVAAKKKSTDEMRIGPITRARAKLIEQQVNLLLIESDYFANENCLLPKSLCVCLLRFIGEEGIAREKEELQIMEHGVEQEAVKDAREEREASVESSGGHHAKEQRKACQHLAAAAPN